MNDLCTNSESPSNLGPQRYHDSQIHGFQIRSAPPAGQKKIKSIKTHYDPLKSIKIHQNLSESIKIHQDPSESIKLRGRRPFGRAAGGWDVMKLLSTTGTSGSGTAKSKGDMDRHNLSQNLNGSMMSNAHVETWMCRCQADTVTRPSLARHSSTRCRHGPDTVRHGPARRCLVWLIEVRGPANRSEGLADRSEGRLQ